MGPIRMAVVISTGVGEQMTVDIPSWNPVTGAVAYESADQMQEQLDDAVKFIDLRKRELEVRALEAHGLKRYTSIAEWAHICDVIDILTGRQDAGVVSRRWQSAMEETAALEQGRLATQQNGHPATIGIDNINEDDCTCGISTETECLYHTVRVQSDTED